MASVDIRTGKMLGCFTGKCSGSIRSIVRHPELPVVASCGLDGYLRLWDTKTRQLLSSVFLKQHILHVLFDSNFIVEDTPKGADSLPIKEETIKEITDGEEIEATPLKRKKSSRNKENVIDGSKKKEPRRVKNTKNPKEMMNMRRRRQETKEASQHQRKKTRAQNMKFQMKGCDLAGFCTI
uniref:Uncharacterized protein n=1 Tax=Medicago truncatula TaxID=3880 RepID=I3STK2_MEDTR|nr:unknown [Medicago truncatula]